MNEQSERGFTIIEIMLAVVVLSVGVMALVSSSALATRMIGRGGMSSQVTQVAAARAELLRAYAAQTSPGCTNAQIKTDSATNATTHITEKWELLNPAGSATQLVRMSFRYRTANGMRADTMYITLYCK